MAEACVAYGFLAALTCAAHCDSLQVLRNEEIFTDPNSNVNGASSATDGDLDAAYAMLLAGQKWHEPLYTDRGIKVRDELSVHMCNLCSAYKALQAEEVLHQTCSCLCICSCAQLSGNGPSITKHWSQTWEIGARIRTVVGANLTSSIGCQDHQTTC